MNLEKYTTFHSPSYVIEIYNKGKYKEIVYGNREVKPSIKECNKDTLYDIASLTKTYTAVLVYMAYEEKKLTLEDSIYAIDNHFIHLKDVTVLDLLSHNQEIWTKGYLGDAKNKDEFYEILYSAYVKENFPTYVDTHYVILSTLLESIYHQDFAVLLKEKICDKLGLIKTTTNPSDENIASNNYEELNGNIVENILPGFIHDTKGRIAKKMGITTGHASIFTTGQELLIFLKSFLDNSLLKKETIELMLSHQDRNQMNFENLKKVISVSDLNTMYEMAKGKDISVKVMRTYNYMGTRYRNTIHALNDVPNVCSDNTIAFSGFTGPSFIIDFDAKIIVVVMCNVMHTTKLSRSERKETTDKIIAEICNSLYK